MTENFAVTPEGVQLPAGHTFPAHGHINIKITTADGSYIRDAGIHFDPNNGHPGGQWIGQSFYPVDLADGECISWVQVHGFNYHFGENGEPPVCIEEPEEPKPEEPEEPKPEEPKPEEPKPDPVTRTESQDGDPDCETLTVTTTTTTESAGYYLGDDGEWHLGDFFPVESVVTTREATEEECPTEPKPEEPPVETEGPQDTPQPPITSDSPAPQDSTTTTTANVPQAGVQELAATGADPLAGAVLTLALGAAGVIALAASAFRRTA